MSSHERQGDSGNNDEVQEHNTIEDFDNMIESEGWEEEGYEIVVSQ
jgi:hypothetical protein